MDESCGTVTVLPAFDPGDVSVNCNLIDTEVTVGETATLEADITNGSERETAVDVDVVLNGSVADSFSVVLSPGGSETTVIDIVAEDVGEIQPTLEYTAEAL